MYTALVHATVGPPIHGELISPPLERAPAILVLHELFGLNDGIRAMARHFAGEGYHALALDLFGGKVATTLEEGRALAQAMQTGEAMAQVQAAVNWLRGWSGCTGKVGITGYCLGGGQALAAACTVCGLSAVVPYYGFPPMPFATWSKVEAPIQGHYGARDTFIPPERVHAVLDTMKAAGVQAEFHLYDAGHAFMREGDPSAYHAPSAELAWSRTLAFLAANLGE